MLFPFVLRLRHGLRSMRGDFLCLLLALFFFGLLTSSAHAQSASVNGQVVDPSGALVRGVEITLTNQKTNTLQHTKTNNAGMYILSFVAPGTYSVHAEATGFKPYTQTNITVSTAQNLELDFRLAVGDTSQNITVDGSSLSINTTDASVSTVVDRQFVENIPLNGRSFQSLLSVVPGVSIVPVNTYGGAGFSGEVTVNGQRTEANYFTVDGVAANIGVQSSINPGWGGGYGGAVPSESALGTTQTLIALDALQEFRAATSTYSAEYGRTPGGQFSFSSRSGTNELHGNAFDYFRNNALDANNWFNNYYGDPRLAERQNDFGGTLGGPVRIPHLYDGRDKTFFFFSYEGLRLTSAFASTLNEVPSLALRAVAPAALQPWMNAFPLPNGPNEGGTGVGFSQFTAGYSAPSSLNATSVRVDHHFNDKFMIFGRYNYAPSDSVSRLKDGLSSVITNHTNLESLTLGSTNVFTPAISNEFRLNAAWAEGAKVYSFDDFGGATPLTLQYLNSLPGVGGNNQTEFGFFANTVPALEYLPSPSSQRQLNIVDTVNMSFGRHVLKMGVDYRRIFNAQALPPILLEAFLSAQDVPSGTSSFYFADRTNLAEMKPVFSNFSAFAQDDWKVTPRLSLSLGVRWDLNPAPKDADGNNPYAVTSADLATTGLAPDNTQLFHTSYADFAPRVGVTYQAHQGAGYETVVRVGGGLFYDTGNAQGAQGYFLTAGMSGQSAPSGGPFPATQALIDSIPGPSTASPYNNVVSAYDPNLKMPRTWEWNVAVEQALGEKQTLTLDYVGSAGRKLLMQKLYYPPTNPNFTTGNGIYLSTNGSSADYDSLQVKFQRRLARGLQALLAYTWSHALDDVTSNFWVYVQERASSDNDVRHNFQGAITYDLPGKYQQRLAGYALEHWSLDSRISARSALPIDVLGLSTLDPVTGADVTFHPNRIPDVPLYVKSPGLPGGRVINCQAFVSDCSNPSASLPSSEGNSGRNIARGFDAVQADLALRRDFPFTERFGLQFRVEAFNLFNHPIYGSIYNQLNNSPTDADGTTLFGQAHNTESAAMGGLNALYQTGGPRSLQVMLKLHF